MGADPGTHHNGLTEVPEKKKIIIVIQKKAAERNALRDKILFDGMKLETLEKEAFHVVKQAVMEGASFLDLYQAAVGMGLGKVAGELLPTFENKLIGETYGDIHRRLVKHAISKAPSELISEDLGNTTIINGAQDFRWS